MFIASALSMASVLLSAIIASSLLISDFRLLTIAVCVFTFSDSDEAFEFKLFMLDSRDEISDVSREMRDSSELICSSCNSISAFLLSRSFCFD